MIDYHTRKLCISSLENKDLGRAFRNHAVSWHRAWTAAAPGPHCIGLATTRYTLPLPTGCGWVSSLSLKLVSLTLANFQNHIFYKRSVGNENKLIHSPFLYSSFDLALHQQSRPPRLVALFKQPAAACSKDSFAAFAPWHQLTGKITDRACVRRVKLLKYFLIGWNGYFTKYAVQMCSCARTAVLCLT